MASGRLSRPRDTGISSFPARRQPEHSAASRFFRSGISGKSRPGKRPSVPGLRELLLEFRDVPLAGGRLRRDPQEVRTGLFSVLEADARSPSKRIKRLFSDIRGNPRPLDRLCPDGKSTEGWSGRGISAGRTWGPGPPSTSLASGWAGNAVKGQKLDPRFGKLPRLQPQQAPPCWSGSRTSSSSMRAIALLICRRDQDQRVKEIVEILKKENKKYL